MFCFEFFFRGGKNSFGLKISEGGGGGGVGQRVISSFSSLSHVVHQGVGGSHCFARHISPAISVKSGLEGCMGGHPCPILYIIHVSNSWPTLASLALWLALNNAFGLSQVLLPTQMTKVSHFPFHNLAK